MSCMINTEFLIIANRVTNNKSLQFLELLLAQMCIKHIALDPSVDKRPPLLAKMLNKLLHQVLLLKFQIKY